MIRWGIHREMESIKKEAKQKFQELKIIMSGGKKIPNRFCMLMKIEGNNK